MGWSALWVKVTDAAPSFKMADSIAEAWLGSVSTKSCNQDIGKSVPKIEKNSAG
ncbi:hypothetical protein NBRC116493_06810 [Aurantivibrio infirmus]